MKKELPSLALACAVLGRRFLENGNVWFVSPQSDAVGREAECSVESLDKTGTMYSFGLCRRARQDAVFCFYFVS